MRNNLNWHPANVRAHRDLSATVREFEIRPEGGARLWSVGSHLDVQVMVNGRAFLFFVVSWIKPAGDLEETIRQRAEAALMRQKQDEASRMQISGARQRIPTKVYLDKLPFPYVPV